MITDRSAELADVLSETSPIKRTLLLWAKCQAARKANSAGGTDIAHAAATDLWNSWAKIVAGKKPNEKEWSRKQRLTGDESWTDWLGRHNQASSRYLRDAAADFSGQTLMAEDGAPLDFSGFVFPGPALFENNTQFKSDVSFRGAHFHDDALFGGASFAGVAKFSDAVFEQDAGFSRAVFLGDYNWFNNCHFKLSSRFRGSRFEQQALFFDSKFDDLAWFFMTEFNSAADFSGATFSGDAVFKSMKARSAVEFSGARFLQVPDFTQATFAQPPRLDNFTVPGLGLLRSIAGLAKSTAGWKREDALKRDNAYRGWQASASTAEMYRAMRTLGLTSSAAAGRLQQNEVRARRWTEDKPWSAEFVCGLLFDIFSGFGKSIARPLVFWAAATAIFAAIYMSGHLNRRVDVSGGRAATIMESALSITGLGPASDCLAGKKTLNDPVSSAWLTSLRQSMVVNLNQSEKISQAQACLYGMYDKGSTYGVIAEQQIVPAIPNWIVLAGAVQSLLSAALIFFFLLALKRQFQIK